MARKEALTTLLNAVGGATVLAGLFALSQINYLLFHGLAELFAIAVAWSVFLLVWNTRRISSNDALLFAGIAYFFVGFIDLIHTLAYKGMGVFVDPELASNHATQLWIAARIMETATLLLFPLLLGRRIRPWPVVLGCAGVTGFLLASIGVWGIFPDCDLEGTGLTLFKTGVEYVTCGMLALAIGLLIKRREFLDTAVWRLMIGAMTVTIAGELAFTLYTDVYGLSNVVGHLLKVVSFFLVYLALVRSTMAQPLATVFRGVERENLILAQEGRHLRLLHQTTSLFLESGTLDDAVRTLPEMIADHYAVPIVAIELYDVDRQEMVFAGAAGIPAAEGARLRVPVDQTISGTVASSGQAVIALNVCDHADYRAEALRELGVTTFACVPLPGQRGVMGTLAIADRQERPDILKGTDLLRALADSLAQELERHRNQKDLHESKEKFRSISEDMPMLICRYLPDYTISYVNRAYCDHFEMSPEELVGKSILTLIPESERVSVESSIASLTADTPVATHEHRVTMPDQTIGWHRWINRAILDEMGRVISYQSIGEDVTEQKHVESERNCTLEMLEILNARTDLRETMQSLLTFMQATSGCEAVGIRLRNGDDFPYYETKGFSDDFVEAERHLCVQNLDGQLLRDEVGNPVLECMCGNIIYERFDPALPFFTESGSFVSNGTSKLLASTTEADRQARTRNRCNAEGYESVLLVPLRSAGEIFGLLQFNDRRENCFSDGFVARIERLASDVALALAQRRAEDSLRISEERFDLAMDASQDGLFDWNLVTNEIYYSARWKSMLGYGDDELPNDFSVWETLTHQDDIKRSWEMQNELLNKQRDRFEMEFRMKHKHGHWVDILSRANAIFGDDGQAVRIVGTHIDITERKRAEKSLSVSEERLQLSMDAGQAGTWIWDIQEDSVFWDERMQRIFGYEPGEFDGTFDGWRRKLHPEDSELAEMKTREALESGTRYDFEYRLNIREPDGIWRTVNALAVVISDDQEVPQRMAGMCIDITERRRAEQALLNNRTQLKSLASELVLAEERERHRIAVHLHDDVCQYLAFAKMKLQIVDRGLDDESLKEDMADVINALSRMLKEVRTLTFDLSSPVLAEFGLEAATSRWLKEEIEQKHAITTEFTDDGQPKPLDEEMQAPLFRSVRELLTNVIKHSGADKICVHMTRRNDQIAVVIEDDGIGFSPDKVVIGKDRGGFGLFSISERLSQMGGILEVDSQPGQGCTCVLRAPLTL